MTHSPPPSGPADWQPPPDGGQGPPPGASWPQPPAAAPYGTGATTAEERNWAMAAHLGSLAAGLVSGGLLAWLAPLIVMLTKGNESAFVRGQSVEALNFQITAVLVSIVGGILTLLTFGLFGLVLLAYAVFWLVVVIMATVAASNGRAYRYPLTLRLVS